MSYKYESGGFKFFDQITSFHFGSSYNYTQKILNFQLRSLVNNCMFFLFGGKQFWGIIKE